MAAPPSKTLKDLNGKWVMNKKLSSDVDPGLALQGISWLVRKTIGAASVTLDVKQYNGPPSPVGDATAGSVGDVTHIDIDQTATGGLKGSTEQRCLDFVFREHSDWLFGTVRGRSKWIDAADIEEPFLAHGWLEGDEEKAGPNGETHIFNHVENLKDGWTATQVWGFKLVDGVRRYARNIVIAKGDKRVELTLYYDYIG